MSEHPAPHQHQTQRQRLSTISSNNSSSSANPNASTEFRSPNAIPPRVSSTGLNRLSLGQATALAPAPARAVLKPLAEGSWMASSSSSSSAAWTQRQMASGSGMAQRLDQQDQHDAGSDASRARAHQRSASEDVDSSTFSSAHGTSVPASWTSDKEKIVLGPYDYLYARPGKDIRKTMIAAFNIWLKVPSERLSIINKVVGMLHTASLLIDDIEDSSYLRRGIPVAHHIFGTAQTLNSANYVYFQALQELQRLGNPRFTEIYAEELLNLHRGQGLDLYWRDTLTCPSEEDYVEMVGNKTGGLFRLAVKLMMAESEVERDFSTLVTLIGVIFQIRDDYLNLSHVTYTYNKGLCEDLTEGKFSFPIIHAIRADTGNRQLINILKQKPTEDAVKKYAVEYMDSMGSFAYTRKVVRELVERASAMISELETGGNPGDGNAVREIVSKMVIEES